MTPQPATIISSIDTNWSNYYDQVYSFLARRLTNRTDVEDLTTETLEDFFLHTKPENQVPKYLFGIAKNKLNQLLRVKYRKPSAVFPEQIQYTEHHKLFLARLLDCVREHLSDQDKTIVEMSVQYDFSSKDIASELKIEAATVRQRLKRALSKLKQHCKDYWGTFDHSTNEGVNNTNE